MHPKPTDSNQSPSTILEKVILTVILLWAAVLRLGWVGINSFSFDEARVSGLALRMARAADFAELGMQSSTGVPNFPGAVWLFAIPYALSRDPLVATLFAGLISTLAVWGIWWLARQLWGSWVSLGVALLFTAAPFIVFYSRSIWSQNLLAPLAILWAVTAVHGISRGDGRTLALHAFLSGFVGQVHLAGIALALASLWLGLIFRLWRQWKPVSIGILAGVLAATPTLYILGRYGTGAQADLANVLAQPSQTNPHNFRELLNLATANGWEWFWLSGGWQWEAPLASLLPLITTLLSAVLGLALLFFVIKAVSIFPALWQRLTVNEHPTAEQVLILLIPAWAICAPIFFYQSRTPVFAQYQLASVPALFLLMGGAIGWFPREVPTWLKASFTGICLALALTQTAAIAQTLNTIDDLQVEGGMGTPLKYPRAAMQALQADGHEILIHSIGNTPEFDGDAAVFDVLLWGYPHRLVDGRSTLIIPAQPAHLFATFETVPAWQQLPATIRDTEPLPRRENEPPYMVANTNNEQLIGPAWQTADATLQNGASLKGWQMTTLDDGRIRLQTIWQLAPTFEIAQFQQFNHLYSSADPNQPTHVSDISTSSSAWQAGDTLITWADFPPLPADAELIRFDVGMYRWPELQRSPVLGREGDPLAPIQLIP